MPELSRFYGIIITIYYRDHSPPHIHATHGKLSDPEWTAEVAFRDGRILEGYVPRPSLKKVREWLRLHQAELEVAWAQRQRIRCQRRSRR